VPGDVLSGEAKAEAVSRTLGAEDFQLRVPQFGIHLNNGDTIASLIPRKHFCTPKN